ncbi:uncharacterized protein LOC119165552 isoform X1 [Rhipicephalus microplus]|uniref:uncharacterized protein LOC119165552 isoform X1 n=1 Tax=Rhipicephalus microplus TaxID=6941 RepID=UPI003F6A7A54
MQTEVLAAVFVLIATDIILYTAGRDVTEFLDQRQPIWTLKSTRRGNIRCEVDQIETAAPLSVSIKRCIVLERRRCEGRILGVLDAERQEQMTVFYRDIFARTETMLFMALDRSCAIFKVQSLQNYKTTSKTPSIEGQLIRKPLRKFGKMDLFSKSLLVLSGVEHVFYYISPTTGEGNQPSRIKLVRALAGLQYYHYLDVLGLLLCHT